FGDRRQLKPLHYFFFLPFLCAHASPGLVLGDFPSDFQLFPAIVAFSFLSSRALSLLFPSSFVSSFGSWYSCSRFARCRIRSLQFGGCLFQIWMVVIFPDWWSHPLVKPFSSFPFRPPLCVCVAG
ncbi:unnamed protein product, partial [Linum tenue]